MKTSVIGFPRVGKDRELKFASEKYFAGEVSAQELEQTAKELRAYGWKNQKDNGISFIPSGDFSFYDNMLDTTVLLGATPKRYRDLGLSALDTYFAMARGYQGSAGDVKALAMKKWFNTNYHYMVPELEDITLKADTSTLIAAYKEAESQGIQTVPAVIGPYTFLKLARYVGNKTRSDFTKEAADAYIQVIKDVTAAGAAWISIAEPALVLDMSDDDLTVFNSLYRTILASKGSLKVNIQTYFGDIRDSYKAVTSLGFDGIGLDFIEGRRTLELLQANGFPKNTVLFAGIVNGKYIWKRNYQKKIDLIEQIKKHVESDNIVLSTSCSLLHVPYTTASETKLSQDILKHFAFAEEKLVELKELSQITEGNTHALESNKALFATERVQKNKSVQEKLATLKDSDFIRQPAFAEREEIQKKEFNLPLLPTTTIGSFPQTKEVRAIRSSFKKGKTSQAEYEDFMKKKIAECIGLQEEIGLDVLVHGEFERNDMVEYFGDHLDGYVFTEKAWVQSYGTRCVKPPIVWGDVSRRQAITVAWSKYAQSCTKKYVKGMLTGPVTILNWSFPREDISLKEQTNQIALAIREEVLDLEANGIRIIQIDEAALREKLPLRKQDWHSEYLDWAVPAFRLVHSGVKPGTQIHTHMCYSEFNDIIKDIDDMDADVITFEASRSDLKILDALQEAKFRTEVGPGVYDIHSPRVPSVQEIKDALGKMLKKVELKKLWVNPDCGLKTRGDTETKASLINLVTAAKEIRSTL
ncbi:MAG: 5-methyltetrahydropteroyltriglutamate--homocysteine S-methyltransferase [Treponema sp.]|nr:5-methyltetrahydropteroyltriglutamate--homocysteine S-methyltransferase [Treponema sp.]